MADAGAPGSSAAAAAAGSSAAAGSVGADAGAGGAAADVAGAGKEGGGGREKKRKSPEELSCDILLHFAHTARAFDQVGAPWLTALGAGQRG